MSLFEDAPQTHIPEPPDTTDAAVEGLFSPQSSDVCLGHEEQEQDFLASFYQGVLPHAMTFCGIEGIGKTTMAFRLARFLLKHGKQDITQDGLFADDLPQTKLSSLGVSRDEPVFRRVASGGHADLLHIHRQFNKDKGKQDSSLKVNELRKIEPFLRRTSSEGGWRIVIVEDADMMNRNAQNAILKILEEPPKQVLIILVAHRPGKLISTIHSRARQVHFDPLSSQVISELIEKNGVYLSEEDKETLAILSDGSIGQALKYLEYDGLNILDQFIEQIAAIQQCKLSDVNAFSQSLSAPSQDKSYRIFVETFLWVMRKILFLKARGQPSLPDCLDREPIRTIFETYTVERLIVLCDDLKTHFDKVDFSNLDRRDAVRSGFLMLRD